ncbi:carboxymuconolactone decarboxylase family protein [Mycolicibacterium sp. P9-64]|uniref:carboxymuconolactone decarboxylase family protein n=1 Tax=Mycolicibacterium sp. P9-64 TaxID=2024612 RepID=UPI0011EF64D1|nr:carboxymuconolactone decarboxylase family protein [Mycolicibacterium sp. P9-64]KAA0077276.1 carboxymuconolactone decarboxylase family protein [Mycolicibacterium sp. P9-64]
MDYPDLDALPQNLKDTLAQHAPVNVYRMVMHSPGLAPGFFVMADAMFQANSLPPHLRELAILRVGYRYAAPYETHQHEMIAGYAGLSAEAIAAAASGVTDDLPQDEVNILTWTDRLLDNHTLSGVEREDALASLTVTQLADLVMTVGFYQLVCNFLNTFEVTTEGEPTYG